MIGTEAPRRTEVSGRLGTAAAWTSAAACLPYLVLKALWAVDVPLGVVDRSELDSEAWVAANAAMALVQLAAVALVLVLVRPWSLRLPAWVLLAPAWVGTGLLAQVVVGSMLAALASMTSAGADVETGAIAPWVYILVYAAFAVQGIALAIAFGCHVQARWGPILAMPSASIRVAPASRRPRSARPAEVTAALAVVLAAICLYWAAGGTLGLSDARTADTPEMQLSRAAGAVAAAAGLLALAGRWGRQRSSWLPAALVWIGSGAMVAFDLLTVVVNRIVFLSGTAPPEAEWAPSDTVLSAKVLVGLVTLWIGVRAARAVSDAPRPAETARAAGR